MTYEVSLPNFEGPLDLLYHLVKKAEVDIYDIPISKITYQYLAYLEEWQKLDLEITSEFLVMAANLMEIKSKMLLPKPVSSSVEDEEDDIDPRQELINKLVEYKFFKELASELKDIEAAQLEVYRREYSPPSSPKYNQNIGNVTVLDLFSAYERILFRYQKEEEVKNIKAPEIRLEDQKNVLLDTLNKSREHEILFDDFCCDLESKIKIVVTFLALLDLLNKGKVKVFQHGLFHPIWIKLMETPKPNKEETVG